MSDLPTNHPPLVDQLAIETDELAQRARDLVAQADKAVCTNRDDAEKCTLLAGLIKTHLKEVDEKREARKRPFLEDGRTVDAHFNGIAGTLATVDPKKRLIGGPLFKLMNLIDDYRIEQERIAAAERLRLEEEARKAREEAAAAELARQQAVERADAAEAREAAVQALTADARADGLQRAAASHMAAPITTAYGIGAGRRATYAVEIVDMKKALAHAIKVNSAAIKACVQTILEAQVRVGVRDMPGVKVIEGSKTTIRT